MINGKKYVIIHIESQWLLRYIYIYRCTEKITTICKKDKIFTIPQNITQYHQED